MEEESGKKKNTPVFVPLFDSVGLFVRENTPYVKKHIMYR